MLKSAAVATRTVNPLHFEDLEPHRFEDMVRQLVYDFRTWASLEPLGRLGSDDGIDIRGIEKLVVNDYSDGEQSAESEVDADQNGLPALSEQREWHFQCKRMKSIGPAEVTAIVQNDLSQQVTLPYAYVLVAACDFSKRARDAFRAAVVAAGIQEFYVWGKAELEDMLFQSKNDHLLFAYFNISLQVRRRSMRTEVRSKITLKRSLVKVLGELKEYKYINVLIRDPRHDDYPFIKGAEQKEDVAKRPLWRYWKFARHHPPYALDFVVHEYLAYASGQDGTWDAIFDYDLGIPTLPRLFNFSDAVDQENSKRSRQNCHSYWNNRIPDANRGYLQILGSIPYDRILALDELGDGANEGPHLLVDYRSGENPFEDNLVTLIRPLHPNRINLNGFQTFRAEQEKRVQFFPETITEADSKSD